MTIIKTDCPHCQQPVELSEADAQKGVTCPVCFKFFRTVNQLLELGQATQNLEAKHLRAHAIRFTALAVLLFCASFIAFLFAMHAVFNQESSLNGFIIMALLLGSSFWLYLIAQVIHIRANTEK